MLPRTVALNGREVDSLSLSELRRHQLDLALLTRKDISTELLQFGIGDRGLFAKEPEEVRILGKEPVLAHDSHLQGNNAMTATKVQTKLLGFIFRIVPRKECARPFW